VQLDLAWWELGERDPSAAELLASPSFQSARKEWDGVPNLLTKLWLASGSNPRWGALMIWTGDKPPVARLPRNISAELIGRPPDHRLSFDVIELNPTSRHG
jgi:trans-2,3-dihydro-3-hydroxyanthranilate isomerase